MKNEGYDFENDDVRNMSLENADVSPAELQKCIDASFDKESRDECENNTLLEKER